MRTTAFCLLALLAAASVADARDLFQDPVSTECKSEAVTSLTILGSGGGRARTESFCEAEAQAVSTITEVLSVYYASVFEDSSTACTKEAALEAVEGLAMAVATAYSSVATEVEIVGTGEACASGFAGGSAFAISVVDIMVDLSVKLIEDNFPGQGYSDDIPDAANAPLASGRATGNAVAVIISEAWTQATAAACQEGTGFASDFQAAFVESVSTAIASLFAKVVVELCSNFDDADKAGLEAWQMETSSSVSEVLGDVDVDANIVASATDGGIADGSAGEVSACDGNKLTRCCSENAKKNKSCACGRGCFLTEVTNEEGVTGIKTWIDNAAVSCFCPPS